MARVHEETNEEQGVREAMMAVGDPARASSCSRRSRPSRRSRSSSTAAAPACSRSPTASTDIDAVCATLRERGLRLLYDDPQARHERQPRQLHPPEGRRRRARGARGDRRSARRTEARGAARAAPAPTAPSQRYAGHSARRSRPPPRPPPPGARPKASAAASVTAPTAQPLRTTHDGTAPRVRRSAMAVASTARGCSTKTGAATSPCSPGCWSTGATPTAAEDSPETTHSAVAAVRGPGRQ